MHPKSERHDSQRYAFQVVNIKSSGHSVVCRRHIMLHDRHAPSKALLKRSDTSTHSFLTTSSHLLMIKKRYVSRPPRIRPHEILITFRRLRFRVARQHTLYAHAY